MPPDYEINRGINTSPKLIDSRTDINTATDVKRVILDTASRKYIYAGGEIGSIDQLADEQDTSLSPNTTQQTTHKNNNDVKTKRSTEARAAQIDINTICDSYEVKRVH